MIYLQKRKISNKDQTKNKHPIIIKQADQQLLKRILQQTLLEHLHPLIILNKVTPLKEKVDYLIVISKIAPRFRISLDPQLRIIHILIRQMILLNQIDMSSK